MCRNCKTACRNSNQTQVKQTICDITVKLLVETLIWQVKQSICAVTIKLLVETLIKHK